MINHRSSWAAAAVVCRCGNRFLCPLCSLQVARGRNLSHSPAAAGVKSFAGVSWNAAHRGVTRNITERFPAGRVITVMRLSPWRRPGVTGDSQDRWRMPSAMEITAGKTAMTFRRVWPCVFSLTYQMQAGEQHRDVYLSAQICELMGKGEKKKCCRLPFKLLFIFRCICHIPVLLSSVIPGIMKVLTHTLRESFYISKHEENYKEV